MKKLFKYCKINNIRNSKQNHFKFAMSIKTVICIGYLASILPVGHRCGVVRDYSPRAKIPNSSSNTNVQHVHHHGIIPWMYDPWFHYPGYYSDTRTSWRSESTKNNKGKNSDGDDELGVMGLLLLLF